MNTTQSAPLAHHVARDVDGMAQIGPTKFQLRGIRFAEGEDGAGAGDAAAQSAAAAAAAAGTAGSGDDSAAPWTKENFDPDRAYKLVENLRADLASSKTKTDAAIAAAAEKAQKDTLAQFAKLLTGEKEPETDPVKLAATIAEKDTALTAAQSAAVEQHRIAAAAVQGIALGANIPALLADPTFKTSLGTVDPTDEAAVKAAITQALQANAALKQPPRSSGDIAPTGPTVQSLETLLAAAEKSGNAAESIVLKRRIAELRTKS